MNEKYGVIIHPDCFDDILKMTDEECGKVVHNMVKAFMGQETEKFDDRFLDFVSDTYCGRVARDKERSDRATENGRKGGGQIGNSNAKRAKNEQKTSKKRAKTNSNTNTNTNTNTNNKRLYGECQNVLLTDEEYKKIVDQGLTGLIEELSLYIAGKGDKYKSHYAVIRQWANRREKEKPRVKQNSFTLTASQRDYNFDDLEKRLVKN